MGRLVLTATYTLVLIEICKCAQASAETYSGCSPGRQRVISYDTTLVPPSGVKASSQGSIFNPDDYLFHRNNLPLRLWCTARIRDDMDGLAEGRSLSELLQDDGPYDINVTFSEPLLLTHILSSGFVNGYVNNFTISQSLEEGGPLMPYNHSDESKEFLVVNIDTVFELNPPLAARKIRFNILDGLVASGGKLCWHLTLLGCTLPEAVPNMDSWNPDNTTSQKTSLPSLIPKCTMVGLTPSPTSSISSTSTPSISSSLPSSCPSAIPSVSSSSCSPSPSTSTSAAPTEVTRTSSSTTVNVESSKESCSHRIILTVVPMAIGGLLVLACLLLVCVCLCLSRRYSRDDREYPERQIDALGMVDNELYKSRSSMYPASIALGKHMPTHDNKNGSCSNGGGGALANMSREAIYDNCDSVMSAYEGSKFGDSMNPRSTCTTEFEQSVDSMVDNPTYSVPFPVDYHSVKPFPKRNAFPPILALSCRATGASHIDMVDNECYSLPFLKKRDDMEGNLLVEIQEPPLDYETPK